MESSNQVASSQQVEEISEPMRKSECSPTATMVRDHQIVGSSTLKAAMRPAGRREQVVSCHAVFRGPPDTIPGPFGHPLQQPMWSPIPPAERRWLCRTAAGWSTQLAWVHPAPLDRLAVDGAGAAEADATESDDSEPSAELDAVFPAALEALRAGVTGGGGAGKP